MAEITFANKTTLAGNELPSVDEANKLTAENVNEIKEAVNSKADQDAVDLIDNNLTAVTTTADNAVASAAANASQIQAILTILATIQDDIETLEAAAFGGTLPGTTEVDETANSEHTITFNTPKVYKNCTGALTFDLNSAALFQTVQIIEHVSSSELQITTEFILMEGEYIANGETKNIIYAHKIDGESLVRVAITQEINIDLVVENLAVSGAGVGTAYNATYDAISGETKSIYRFITSPTAGGTPTLRQESEVNAFVPHAGLEGLYINIEVKVGKILNGVVVYSPVAVSNWVEITAAPVINIITAESNFTFTSGGVEYVTGDSLWLDNTGNGTPYKITVDLAYESEMVLLPDAGDTVVFKFDAPNGAKTYSKLSLFVRTGNASDNSYIDTYLYNIELATPSNPTPATQSFSFDSDRGTQNTSDAGGARFGYIVLDNITLDAIDNEIYINSQAAWAVVDHIEIID